MYADGVQIMRPLYRNAHFDVLFLVAGCCKSLDLYILAFNGIATECYVALNVLTLIDVFFYALYMYARDFQRVLHSRVVIKGNDEK